MSADKKSLEYFLQLEYSLNLIADPDGGYVVMFPDLPGCITQGDTLQEALYMAEDARAGWIETEYERSDGDIPMPSYPVEYRRRLSRQTTGKFNVRLPKSLHQALSESAERDGVSLNQYVVMLLSRGEAEDRVTRRNDVYNLITA